MEYTAIHCMSLANLTKQANTLLNEGWRPQGGICGTESGNWAQAFVRESSDNGSSGHE